MNLQDLIKKGGFVDVAPVKKDVEWKRPGPDGAEVSDKFTIFVKKQSFGSIEVIYGNETDKSKMSKYISESVRLGDKGQDEIPYEQAMLLDPGLGAVFIQAVNEVNGLGRATPKN
jgi:hypothetical protein